MQETGGKHAETRTILCFSVTLLFTIIYFYKSDTVNPQKANIMI